MKKFFIILVALAFISGCATYKFHHGQSPYDKGYVVSRDNYTIIEYTLGKDNSVPGIKLAKERFERRRKIVEDYYKKMDLIQNRFKMAVWDPWVMFWKMVAGIFRLPFIAVSDYKYEHNPEYREKIEKMQDEKDAREDARIAGLREQLNNYIQEDLQKEEGVDIPKTQQKTKKKFFGIFGVQEKKDQKAAVEKIKKEKKAMPIKEDEQKKEAKPIEIKKAVSVKKEEQVKEPQLKQTTPLKEKKAAELGTEKNLQASEQSKKPIVLEEAKKETEKRPLEAQKEAIVKKEAIGQKEKEKKPKITVVKEEKPEIKAIIAARPLKGYSPLRVKFSAARSYSRKARIVSYFWDFGDSDTSDKENPVNIFYSGSSEPVYFTVTLTVKDNQGNTARDSTIIEVLNK